MAKHKKAHVPTKAELKIVSKRIARIRKMREPPTARERLVMSHRRESARLKREQARKKAKPKARLPKHTIVRTKAITRGVKLSGLSAEEITRRFRDKAK